MIGSLFLGILLGLLSGVSLMLTGYGILNAVLIYAVVGIAVTVMVPLARSVLYGTKKNTAQNAEFTH